MSLHRFDFSSHSRIEEYTQAVRARFPDFDSPEASPEAKAAIAGIDAALFRAQFDQIVHLALEAAREANNPEIGKMVLLMHRAALDIFVHIIAFGKPENWAKEFFIPVDNLLRQDVKDLSTGQGELGQAARRAMRNSRNGENPE